MIDESAVVHRLDELRAEIAAGERALRELDARREQLVAGLMRLGGAAQALEEVLAAERAEVP
jgi:cell division protein FtsB